MKPITREEMYLAAAAGYDVTPPEPVTRKEMFLAKLAGMEVETPAVFTRQERFLDEAAVALSRSVIEPLEVTENGTYTAPDGVDGYSPVTVNVPEPEINLQDKTITENGTYTADSGYDGLGSVEVNVKGGGGLPAGGYWGVFEDVPRPYNGNYIFAELGGDLYAFTAGSNAETYTGIMYKYKMVDGAWVQLADETYVDADMYKISFVEFNGKLHFVPKSESSHHWTFDGTTMVKMANHPGYVYPLSLFVQDNKLKVIYRNTVYVWDEATDTWTTEATLSAIGAYAYVGVYVVNGVVYMVDQKNVFIYANKAVTKYATTTKSAGSTTFNVVVNGKLYYYEPNNLKGTSLYCFDFATKTDRYVTKVPTQLNSGACYLKFYKGKLLSLQGKPTFASIFQLYEVTE